MFLLDTNVVSELRKAASGKADRNVAAWAASVPASAMFLSVLVLRELELGVLLAKAKDPVKAAVLREWLDGWVLPAFVGRVLPIDADVALRSAALQVPTTRPIINGLIAATALVHGMTMVTRNTAEFGPMGVTLLNPWAPS